MKKIFVLMSVLLLIDSSVFADIVVLKSYKVIEGKIIERTDKYIKIDFQGVPLTYYLSEIESINAKDPTVPTSWAAVTKHKYKSLRGAFQNCDYLNYPTPDVLLPSMAEHTGTFYDPITDDTIQSDHVEDCHDKCCDKLSSRLVFINTKENIFWIREYGRGNIEKPFGHWYGPFAYMKRE